MRDRVFFFMVILAAVLVLAGIVITATDRAIQHTRAEMER